MVLLQLLSEDKKRKKLLSVDKDAEFQDIHAQIAEKLEIPSVEGYVVSQIDDRDGEAVKDMLPNDKLSALPRLGGGHFLWVREADAETRRDKPEAVIGANPADAQPSAIAEDPESRDDGDNTPVEKEPEVQESEQKVSELDTEDSPPPAAFASPSIKEKGKSGAKPPSEPTQPLRASKAAKPSPPKQNESPKKEVKMQLAPSAVTTESYDVDYGKYRDFTKAVIKGRGNFEQYPIKYANVERKAVRGGNVARVTTLMPDASDNKAPDCLRESYNWTSVGKYRDMTQIVMSDKKGGGKFKSSESFPRFAPDSSEAELKKIFKHQMRVREKEKTVGDSPKRERNEATKKALRDALKPEKKEEKP